MISLYYFTQFSILLIMLFFAFSSELECQFQSKVSEVEESKWSETKLGVEKNLTCCKECFAGYNKEAQSIALSNSYYNEYSTTTSISSSLPSWLQKYKQENKSSQTTNDQVPILPLCPCPNTYM